jgi:hypothetical protein
VYPPTLQRSAAEGVAKLFADLEETVPHISERLRRWLESVFGPAALEEVFMRPDAFPLLLFPWWFEQSVREPDPSLHQDLSTSSISGYLYIRLIDNLMDGDAPVDVGVLPALSVLHTRFTDPFHERFAPFHPFWEDFRTIWFDTAEVTLHDAALASIDREQFEAVSARKTGAAKIPLAAAAHTVGRPDLLPDWYRLVERFGCWHQMMNDLFGWHKDLRNGSTTYLLSEGRRVAHSPESLESWFANQGFDWAVEQLDAWMSELQVIGDRLGSPAVLTYLNVRQSLLHDQAARVRSGLRALTELGRVVGFSDARTVPGQDR